MPSDKWQQVNDLFHAALELDPSARSEFLSKNCDDPAVSAEVISLLAAHQNAGGFIESAPAAVHDLLEEHQPVLPSEMIGVYRIIQEIGRGGMGAVYLAYRADEAFKKHVAVKVLKSGMDTAEVLRHFQNERQILADFDHPNIARLLDGGTTQSGLPYFVMEYVEGVPVDIFCDKNRLNIEERLKLFRQICAAVSYAHRHLVIHRDLKPSNIFVTAEGVPKLLDFGIAKILNPDRQGVSTATGIHLMTPEYASPEQMLGLAVTTVSDVYSLGVLLYELLVGRLPYDFSGRSPLEIARLVHDTQPLLSSAALDSNQSIGDSRKTTVDQLKRDLRGDLDNILSMAIRKEPERRYQSVEQFSEDIRRHLERLPVVARKDTIVYRFTKFTKRNPFAVAAAIVVFLTLLTGVIATTWQAQKARSEQKSAELAREFSDELRYIETLLLSTYTAPIHDARQNLGIAKHRLNELQRRMDQSGALSYASGNNALGNGYLMLKDYDRAKIYLERAWNAGYRAPSSAYALGKTLGNLYQQAVINADQFSSMALKQKAMRDAELQYSRPAIQYLRQAQRYAESPDYVEGLIALYQKRFDEALQKTIKAFKTSSRPYEVMKLQGDIYFNEGRNFMDQGNEKAGMQAFRRAGEAYARASDIARSDPDIYLADALRITRMISAGTEDASQLVVAAITACDQAIQINPDADKGYLSKSDVYLQQGVDEMYRRGMDPRVAFRNAIAQAQVAMQKKGTAAAYERVARANLRTAEYDLSVNADARPSLKESMQMSQTALVLDRYYAEAHLDLASAKFLYGQYQLDHGEDPTESLKEVIRIYDQQLSSLQKELYSYNLLALAHMAIGEYQIKRGINPASELDESVKLYSTALHMNPDALYLYEGLALSYVDLAKYQIDTGTDPSAALQIAVDEYHKSVDQSAQSWTVFNLALAHMTRAEYKIKVLADPEEDLVSAEKYLKQAKELAPDLAPATLQAAECHILRARYLLLKDQNPREELNRAQKLLDSYSETDPANAELLSAQSTVHFLTARWQAQKKVDAQPAFASAVTFSEKAIAENPNELHAYIQFANICFRRAEWMMKQSDAQKWIDLGLQQADRADKINPASAEVLAVQASLLHLKSRLSNDPALDDRAKAMLKEAFEKNPFLKNEYSL